MYISKKVVYHCAVIGRVSGVRCLVVANDATVKGGTVYPISMRAQLRLQALALQLGLPVVYVADSGGAYLPLQAQLFTYGGQCFFNEAILNAAGIPQVCVDQIGSYREPFTQLYQVSKILII